jgi:hypothetical protein
MSFGEDDRPRILNSELYVGTASSPPLSFYARIPLTICP